SARTSPSPGGAARVQKYTPAPWCMAYRPGRAGRSFRSFADRPRHLGRGPEVTRSPATMFDHARLVRLITAALASCAVTWALAVGSFAVPATDVPTDTGATAAPAFKAVP